MNKPNWQEAKDLFDAAMKLEAVDRPAFLDRECAGDDELSEQVKGLLAAYDSEFLESPVVMNACEVLLDDNFASGQAIGRYVLRNLIGTGGMGQVYLADDTELDRPVAFKVLHRDVADDAERVRRFIQEAKAASALNHPNILTIHEIGTFEGSRFIVSEYIDGETLRDRMVRGLTVAESVDITCQVATALHAAHSAGIVHRDIKPENVMIRHDGLVKVLDFGLAKLTELDDRPIDATVPASSVQTSPGLVMGTVAYMSPEQAGGQPVDARTDLWSLGVVFHEMLTGRSMFDGGTAADLIGSILKSDPVIDDSVPPDLRPICQKALTKDKHRRYSSANDLLTDLQGEKKRMEYAIQPPAFISSSSTDDLRTQLIRPRPTLSAEYIVTSVKRHKYATLFTVVLVAFAGIGLSVYRYNGATPSDQQKNLAAVDSAEAESDVRVSRLPISGAVREIVISPDGKYLAYSAEKGIRLMDRATSTETEILAQGSAGGLKFSPDGQFIYYSVRINLRPNVTYAIMKLSINGGAPEKIVDGPYDGLSFSPDATQIAFTKEDNDGQLIMVANVDGSNARTVARTDWNHSIVGSPLFSPDGKRLACTMVTGPGSGTNWQVVGYSVTDGSMQLVSEKKWNAISGMVWRGNGDLIVVAKEGVSDPSQLWAIQKGMEPRALTSGLTGYKGLSSTRDGGLLVTSQVTDTDNRDLWVMQDNDARTARRLTTTGEFRGRYALAPDGAIVMTSIVAGNPDIWTMNADGGGRKQLTREPSVEGQPAISPDGNLIAFTSTRVGGVDHLFVMDRQGNNVRQLTSGEHEVLASFSEDGKWVYFIDGINGQSWKWKNIRKVPVAGGDSLLVATAPDEWWITGIDVNAADGRLLYGLGNFSDGWHYKLAILQPSNRGTKLIELSGHLVAIRPRWSPDNRTITIMSTVPDGPESLDLWSISADGKGKPRQVTDFRTSGSADPKWTAGGKQMFFTRGISVSNPVLIRNSDY